MSQSKPDKSLKSHIAHERRRAQEIRKSSWWQDKIEHEQCYYCDCVLDQYSATMDHIVPLAQGGKSTKGNLAICCKTCNTEKRSMTAVEWILYREQLSTQVD